MYTLIHNHIRCVDITAGTKATIEYVHADSQLLMYHRTATYLRCTGIVSWLLREIYSNKWWFRLIQRKYWDLECWAEFEFWIYVGREFQMD